jgi:hypothetical protein
VSESTLFAIGPFELAMGAFDTELLGIGLAKGVGLVSKVALFAESASVCPSQREATTVRGISATGGFASLFMALTATSAEVSRLPWFGCSLRPCVGSSARASAIERWNGATTFGETGFAAA